MSNAKLQRTVQQALTHHKAGRLAEASRLYAAVRQAAPDNFDAVHLGGCVALQQGRAAEAVALLEHAGRLAPNSAAAAMRLGQALGRVGRPGEAERWLRQALGLDAKLTEAWIHLGAILRALGRLPEALAAAERAVALRPDDAEAHAQLAALLFHARGRAAAEPHFRRTVALQPARATAWVDLGLCLAQDRRLTEALICVGRALKLDPRLHNAHAARGLALERAFRPAEAAEAYSRAVAGNPRNWQARSARLLALHYLPDIPRAALAREHAEYGAALVAAGLAPARDAARPPRPEPARRLRVAFLSADLRQHSVAYFIEPLLAHLDHAEFEIFLYHDHANVDAISQRLRALAVQWRHVAGQPAEALERLIRADAPDLLVDLAGHTGYNRLPVLARRLAPVQVTYLGYPDTTGVQTMDYRLVDAVTDPEGDAEPLHTEKLVRFAPLAWCYAPPATAPDVALPPCAGGGVTFGCFNNFAKVTDGALTAWGRLLAAVPGGQLVLKGAGLTEPETQASIAPRLAAAGIAPARIRFLEHTKTNAEHLACYAQVDVALDTFPYHGTTTTCEALWMGVPVVSLAGDRHASRVGASLLRAIGHPEWVAADWEDYATKAAALAAEPAKLAAIRAGLRDELRRSPLLDHAGQAARFSAALRAMWREACAAAS